MHEFLAKIQPALVDLAVTVAIALLTMGTAWLRAHAKNTRADGIVDRVTTDIDALVAEQAQVVDKFRGDDGKLSSDEAAKAKDAVMGNLKKLLGVGGLSRITKDLGVDPAHIDTWLSAHIEKSVRSDATTTTAADTATNVVTATATNVAPSSSTPARKSEGGFVDGRMLALMMGLTVAAMIAIGCSALSSGARDVANAVVDCTKKETAATVHELRPLGDSMLSNAIADGKLDWGPVRSLATAFVTDTSRCILADAVARAVAPKPVDPNAPKLSPLEVDATSLRAGFRQLSGDIYKGATFKTEAGTI